MNNCTEYLVKTKPINTNNAYRKRGIGYGMYMTQEGKVYKDMLAWEAQTHRSIQFYKSPEVFLTFTFGTKHKHDIDGCIKLVLDSMEGIFYKNDNDIQVLHVRKFYLKNKPSIHIKIVEMNTGETF